MNCVRLHPHGVVACVNGILRYRCYFHHLFEPCISVSLAVVELCYELCCNLKHDHDGDRVAAKIHVCRHSTKHCIRLNHLRLAIQLSDVYQFSASRPTKSNVLLEYGTPIRGRHRLRICPGTLQSIDFTREKSSINKS